MNAVPKPTKLEAAPDSRSALLTAAKKLFAERGYDGATVKEIADQAGVNVALISYCFGGKEGLFRACLAEFGAKNLETARRILQPPRSQEEIRVRLQMFFEELTSANLAEPEVTVILHRECDMDFPVAGEVFQETFAKIFGHFIEFIRAAGEKGLIRPGLDPLITASLHFSNLIHAFRMDRLAKRMFNVTLEDPAYREKFLKHHLESTLRNLGVPL